MNKKLYLISFALVLICTIAFVSYSRISRATTMSGKHSGSEIAENSDSLDSIMLARAKKYGKIFSSWLNGSLNRNLVPAAAAGIIKGDRLIFHHGVNADRNTKFGIASLSKTFTAVLTLKLSEEGIFFLDDPICKYLPQVIIERERLNSRPVTIRHILSHTSGMPSYGRLKTYEIYGKKIHLPEQVHPAGFCYAYSNDSYVLMMHIIESATGKSYAENLKEKIFDPLGMTSSTGRQSNGTGGIITTINDLSKYASMMINRGRYKDEIILTEASFETMLAKPVELPQTRVDYHYSLSWEVITVDQKVDSFYKAGRWHGEASGVQVFPKRKIAFIYLCNPPAHLTKSFMAWRQGLTGMLRYLVRKISGDLKLCTSWPYLTQEELRRYEGDYVNKLTGEKVKIVFRRNRLFSTKYGGLMPLRTFTSNRFLIGTGRMLHNFVWKENRVIGLALRHGYYKLVH